MTVRYYSSTAQPTTLALNATAGSTVIEVNSLVGYPSTFPYTLCLDFDTGLRELVEVTAAAGTTLTVTRGVDGTSAVGHSAGATVRHVSSARDYADSRTHENSNMGVHGVTGSVVGTTDSQVLTNKTLTSPSITSGVLSGGTSISGTVSGNANISMAGTINSSANLMNLTTFPTVWGTDSGPIPTIGAGSINMKYAVVGTMFHYYLTFRAGAGATFGSGSNWFFTLPGGFTYSTLNHSGSGWARPTNSDSTSVPCGVNVGAPNILRLTTTGGRPDGNPVTGLGIMDANSPEVWNTSGLFFVQGFIELL